MASNYSDDGNDLDALKKSYQSIAAPPYLATRVRANLREPQRNRGAWLPVTGTLTALLAIIVFAPPIVENSQTGSDRALPAKPSLSALAALRPSSPKQSVPTLSSLRSVKTPVAPVKPKLDRSTN